jgi:hypothetical protein
LKSGLNLVLLHFFEKWIFEKLIFEKWIYFTNGAVCVPSLVLTGCVWGPDLIYHSGGATKVGDVLQPEPNDVMLVPAAE